MERQNFPEDPNQRNQENWRQEGRREPDPSSPSDSNLPGPDMFHAQSPYPEYSRTQAYAPRKPWYNQGWLWLIVAVAGLAGIVVIAVMLSGIVHQLGHVNHSLQKQTAALNRQNRLLESAIRRMSGLTSAVQSGFQQLILTLKELTDSVLNAVK